MTSSSSPAPHPAPAGTNRPFVVGIGGSAGAVTALQQFFKALPKEEAHGLGLSFVIVMHLAPEKRSELAEILQSHTSLPVTQVTETTLIENNHVYVTAPGQTLLVQDSTLVPDEIENQEERQFPIDRFFRSLAQASVEPVGVVLSGAGTDGSVGLRVIKEAGGLIAAQDPSEAQHSSMPRSAIGSSRVDLILPVAELARHLSEQPRVLGPLPLLDKTEQLSEEEQDALDEILKDIFDEVRSRTGHDFREYKRPTMLRRIQRRLQVHQIPSLSEYLSFLREQPSEAAALLKDCLISVTSFFRNPDAFDALREEVVSDLLADKGPDDKVRVWTVGCATGEEAFSLSMLFLEQAASQGISPDQIQIFATDLDEEALATARKGRYPEAIATDVPEHYLDRFFQKDGAEYVVRDEVRERVLFTTHNLLKDPPFSKLDLISCRNLLIYLQRDLQRKVFDLFSYALKDGGYLFLGSSESADLAEEDFRPFKEGSVEKSHCLYQRKSGDRKVPDLPSGPLALSTSQTTHPTVLDGSSPEELREEKEKSDWSRVSSDAALHRRLLESYAPPSAVVDEDYRFLHLSPKAGQYLRHPGGTPNDNLVELVRPELRFKLRSALRKAFDQGGEARTQPTGVKFNGETRSVRLVVRPTRHEIGPGELALVLFLEEEQRQPAAVTPGDDGSTAETVEEGALRSGDAPSSDEDVLQGGVSSESGAERETRDERVAQLEAELKQTKEELRATVEEHETSKQEMRAANEELRSMNEEYRSTAEELETSKEELQSVNEELKSVNRELEGKVQELKKANNDLENLMAATDIGTLFLNHELQIQRYTPRIEELFNIRQADEGRPVGDLTHHLDYDRLVADAERVLQDGTPEEREAQSEDGDWFLVRHHPYRTAEDEINGVVITFVEITSRKQAEQDLRQTNEALQKRTEQVQNLTEALTSAEEEERKRLSQVLHDSLQQTLFAAQMKIGNLKGQLTDEQRERATNTRELIADGIETARTLSRELDPPAGKDSLQEALEWLGTQMQESYGLTVNVKAKGSGKTTGKSIQSLLFRISRELLFNAVKHADVDEAFLFLVEGEDRLRIVIADEGKGFDPAFLQDEEGGGHGLVSVRERIEMIGGTFQVTSAPGEGTRITIEVPWESNGGR